MSPILREYVHWERREMVSSRSILPITAITVFLPIFIFLMFGVIADSLGLTILGTKLYEDLALSLPGNILMGILGIIPLGAVISLYVIWRRDEYWRDLRYKMAFYLYHSRVRRGDRIPLAHLAEVGLSKVHDIAGTLLVMIRKGELKGEVDETLGIYLHLGMTRKGIKLVKALPPMTPMKRKHLDDVKRFALKDASISMRAGEDEIVPNPEEGKRSRGKGEKHICPDCGKRNRGNTHFCTYCGEVLD